jgi:hypothetical protein
MNVAGTQAIWVLGLAAVLVAYSSVIFHALKRIARAVGVFFEAKRSAAVHAAIKEPTAPLSGRRHVDPLGAPTQQTLQRLLIQRCRRFISWWWICTHCVGEFMPLRRRPSASGSARQAQPDRSNVTPVIWWRGPPAKPTRPWEAVALVLLSTTAVILVIAAMMFLLSSSSSHVITTGAGEAITTRLPGGSVLSVSANSTLKVVVTDQHWGVRLMEGEAVFDVPANLRRPFVVETVLLTATAAPGTKFRVAIGSFVELDVYEGGVQVLPRGAKAGAAARLLHKGASYRTPIGDAQAPLARAAASPEDLTTGV